VFDKVPLWGDQGRLPLHDCFVHRLSYSRVSGKRKFDRESEDVINYGSFKSDLNHLQRRLCEKALHIIFLAADAIVCGIRER
jgi:hypothetical protein